MYKTRHSIYFASIFVMVLGLFLGRCTLAQIGSSIQPRVTVEQFAVSDVALNGAAVRIVLGIQNPNPVPITLDRVHYDLALAGESLLSGEKKDPIRVEPLAKSSVDFKIDVKYSGLRQGIESILTRSELPYEFKGGVAFVTPMGDIEIPMQKTGTIPVPPLPDLSVRSVAVKEMSPLSSTIMVEVLLKNRGESPLELKQFHYDVQLNGHTVGNASQFAVRKLAGQGEWLLSLPLNVRLAEMTGVLLDSLRSGSFQYAADFKLDLESRYGPYNLNFHREGNSDQALRSR